MKLVGLVVGTCTTKNKLRVERQAEESRKGPCQNYGPSSCKRTTSWPGSNLVQTPSQGMDLSSVVQGNYAVDTEFAIEHLASNSSEELEEPGGDFDSLKRDSGPQETQKEISAGLHGFNNRSRSLERMHGYPHA